MFTIFLTSVVHLRFNRLTMLYKHEMKHVLSKKLIKGDFSHGKKILDAQGDAYLSDALKYASPSCHIAHRGLALKRK